MKTKQVFAIAALGWLAGCGSGSGGGGPIGPAPADVTGTYAAGHIFVLVGLGPITEAPCPGTLEIESQSGASFTGQVSLDAVGECAGFGGVTGTVAGTVSGNEIALTVTGIEDPLAALGCIVTGGEPAFTGTVTTTTIQVTRRIAGRCTIGGDTIEAEVDWTIQATKV